MSHYIVTERENVLLKVEGTSFIHIFADYFPVKHHSMCHVLMFLIKWCEGYGRS